MVSQRGGAVERTHDVRLGSNRHQSVDMLADGDQHLAGHVPALLGSWGLILNMNTCCTTFDKQLRQFHNCRQPSVPGISIGDNGSEIVDIGNLVTVGLGCRDSLFVHFSVVKELCLEQLIHLPGDSVLVMVSL